MTPQEEFDKTYITATEICKELGIHRATVVQGKRRGMLPNPITLKGTNIQLWRRAEVRPFLDAWKINLRARRGELKP